MTTTLPNLSTWHRVPVGAAIPKGTPYACAYEDGISVDLLGNPYDIPVSDSDNNYYTEHPIGLPLPTEEGATILASNDEQPLGILLTRKGGRWVNRYGAEWSADQIASWAPVTIGETVVMR